MTDPQDSRNTVFLKMLLSATVAILLVPLLLGIANAQRGPRIGDVFPRMTLPDLSGKRIILPDDATGRIAVIHISTVWCAICEREMALMQLIQTLYGEKGVVSYWINAGQSVEQGQAFANNTKATYPVLSDPKMEETKQLGGLDIPITFVCDRKGVIRGKVLGEVSKKGVEKTLAPLLQE